MDFERRLMEQGEVRAAGESGEMRISGYAARYNSLSNKIGDANNNFRERIKPGAFKRILSTKPDVVMLRNHDANHILGRTSAGTLTLCSDDKGLAFECLLPNTQAGRDTHESVKRGDLKSCSFAFNLGDRMSDWSEEDEIADEIDLGIRGKAKRAAKTIVRTITDFSSLLDTSVVTFPAYDLPSVDARSVIPAEVRNRFAAESLDANRAINATALAQYTRMQRDRLAEITAELEAPVKRYIDPSYHERT